VAVPENGAQAKLPAPASSPSIMRLEPVLLLEEEDQEQGLLRRRRWGLLGIRRNGPSRGQRRIREGLMKN